MTSPNPEQAFKRPVVCVFCASSPGKNPIHMESARTLAQSLHAANASLVYGGGTLGLMGELAKTLVSLSGPASVHGVIPRALIKTDPDLGAEVGEEGRGKEAEKTISLEEMNVVKEHRHGTPSQLKEGEFGQTTVVEDMHTRKRLMAQKVMDGGPGSGFVVLAGGWGTIEECCEAVTWNQLGIHRLPIVLVNVNGYWDGLLQWAKKSVEDGYVGEKNAKILVEVKDPKDVIDALRNYQVSEARYQLDWT